MGWVEGWMEKNVKVIQQVDDRMPMMPGEFGKSLAQHRDAPGRVCTGQATLTFFQARLSSCFRCFLRWCFLLSCCQC